jgi:ribosomal protein L37E
MPYDEPDDDEDWYDDEDDPGDVEVGSCPECGAPVYEVAERCPACGYWLTAADRRAMWARDSKPLWLKTTAVVVLIAFVLSVLGIASAIF